MARYGIDYYGLSYYGSSAAVSYLAGSFTAQSIDHGYVQLKWASPSGRWSNIRIVRNSYGYPVNAWDGDIVVNSQKEALSQTYYNDYNLRPEAFFYYSMFVFNTLTYLWVRAGDVTGVSVKNYGNGENLYKYLPEIYKITQVYSATADWENEDLRNFLNLFGFELDYAQTITSLLVSRYDTERVNGLLLPSFLQEFGLTYEPEIGYQQTRILVRDAVLIGQKKGSSEGLREFMKAFTGYAVPQPVAGTPNPSLDGLVKSHNLMLDYNDSSFEESTGHWASTDNSAIFKSLVKKSIKSISVTSNVVTAVIGTHNYAVGNKINTDGFAQPLFNTVGSPKTITAVTATSVSWALTAINIASFNCFNANTSLYPNLFPYPTPWAETTALAQYPNKQNGVLAVKNATATAGTVTVSCGLSSPVLKGIPVTGGLSYVFSVYSAAGTTLRGVVLKINWYDRFGDLISTTTGSSVNNTVGAFSARPTVTGSAPGSAYYAVPLITINAVGVSSSNEYHYFDCAQFEQAASVTSFDEARQIHMTLRATRINELKNPHFALISGSNAAPVVTPWTVTGSATTKIIDPNAAEPGAEVWTIAFKGLTSNVARLETTYSNNFQVGNSVYVSGVGAPFDGLQTITAVGVDTVNDKKSYIQFAVTNANIARVASTGTVWFSGNSYKLTATASGTVNVKSWDGTTTSQLMPIHYPNTSYTFSIYLQKLSASTGNQLVTPKIIWYSSSNIPLTTGSTVTGTATNVTSSGVNWDRAYVTGTAPAGAYSAVVELDWAATNTHVLWLDSALFENTSALSPFFDGSSGPGTANDLLWEGAATNAGRSHLYKNRFAIQTRLGDYAVKNQLNLGSTVAIYLAQPKT
jgi:hypothetical protein